jgi:predicted AlkP superfamily pyrophosphatase or phosphodiesterase
MTFKTMIFIFAAAIFFNNAAFAQIKTDSSNIKTLIVFFDGLRPDYITPDAMPNLYAFSKRGCYGKQHHSVFPTVTRVNSSSYASGSYPATNGIMGNTVYFPQVDKQRGLNTGEASEMAKVTAATGGHLLTTVSLGELLAAAGKRMMVFSSGSSGQALFQNHTVSGGAIINTSMILPGSLKPEIEKELGPAPAHTKPNSAQHKWITDALIKYGLTADGPLVSAIWFSDPDGTAHSDGIGAATSMASIKSVDEQFGRIIAYLESKHLTNNFNIIVSTDHGFVTHTGKNNLAQFLIKEGLKKDSVSEDVVVAEGAIYVKDHDEALIKKIVLKLQAQDWIGGIFTKAAKKGSVKGWVNGTISFEAIHWNHPERAGDILVDYNWNDDKNNMGYPGTSFSRGVAGHGGFSPYEVHIALLAAGPSFKQSFDSELPTSNVDIAPTILYIHHLPVPASMDGRVMYELLTDANPHSAIPKKEIISASTLFNGGTYNLIIERTIFGKYKYVNFSKVTRTASIVKAE